MSGKCNCGENLAENPKEICSEENIINIQNLIYDYSMKKEHGINNIGFLESVNDMYNLLKTNIESFQLLKSKFKP